MESKTFFVKIVCNNTNKEEIYIYESPWEALDVLRTFFGFTNGFTLPVSWRACGLLW